ncbi:hypothetical protein AURDEDRAFT_178240 [Auricularia subglabra TFB-10046 SS5]|uniref:Uncharacterized protein n=1 Tax=Auricularia subglabra (strain TFB-10046 / SS5) TaxID=717982 RepID=J0WK44_AURST|nr:hypothetical protein AURDEDRAFT_178240 [Auricularia subglabra TFB-10046 SS5]
MEQPTNRKQGAMRCEVPDRPIDKTAPFGPCGSYDEVPPTVFRWNVVVRLCSVRGTLVAHWWLAMVGLKCTITNLLVAALFGTVKWVCCAALSAYIDGRAALYGIILSF